MSVFAGAYAWSLRCASCCEIRMGGLHPCSSLPDFPDGSPRRWLGAAGDKGSDSAVAGDIGNFQVPTVPVRTQVRPRSVAGHCRSNTSAVRSSGERASYYQILARYEFYPDLVDKNFYSFNSICRLRALKRTLLTRYQAIKQ